MDALPFTPVELVAVDAARNIHRRWRIAAYRDLFGALVVETAWGRIGQGGRRLMRQFDADALRYARALLARRRGSPVRIGIAYVDTSTGR
jgi:predicted DNA-binding WGR domain protein